MTTEVYCKKTPKTFESYCWFKTWFFFRKMLANKMADAMCYFSKNKSSPNDLSATNLS